jgi:hypothetical protein
MVEVLHCPEGDRLPCGRVECISKMFVFEQSGQLRGTLVQEVGFVGTSAFE